MRGLIQSQPKAVLPLIWAMVTMFHTSLLSGMYPRNSWCYSHQISGRVADQHSTSKLAPRKISSSLQWALIIHGGSFWMPPRDNKLCGCWVHGGATGTTVTQCCAGLLPSPWASLPCQKASQKASQKPLPVHIHDSWSHQRGWGRPMK